MNPAPQPASTHDLHLTTTAFEAFFNAAKVLAPCGVLLPAQSAVMYLRFRSALVIP
jgi:hypothetical protein